jgi:hypothetical protein
MLHLFHRTCLFHFFHHNYPVRAVWLAVAAVYANLRLVFVLVPKNRPKWAGFHTVAAADAQLGFQPHPGSGSIAILTYHERIGWTDARAGRVLAGPADNYDEPLAESACRAHPNARIRQPAFAKAAGAGKHTLLAPHAAFRIIDCQPFHHMPYSSA